MPHVATTARSTGTDVAPRTRGDDASPVRAGLAAAADRLGSMGLPRPGLGGKLIRPRIAYLGLPEPHERETDERFWMGALAIQMAHEASLIHDDVIDQAQIRRGRPTLAAERGIGHAVVAGDHLLTCAYRAASLTESPRFMSLFAESVERTVAGEILQARTRGSVPTMDQYREIVRGKTGRLFGCALASGAAILDLERVDSYNALGQRMGVFYQMLDDFLDLCPSARTGKAPLQDYRGKVWTWPLEGLIVEEFRKTPASIFEELFGGNGSSPAPIDLALQRLQDEAAGLNAELVRLGSGGQELARIIQRWTDAASTARADEAEARARSAPRLAHGASPDLQSAPEPARARVATRARALGGPAEWRRYFARNSRSFRFAARLFPEEPLQRVTEVYAFCRFTDDLVDEQPDADASSIEIELDVWLALARDAYEGRHTGVPLLDHTMRAMAEVDVPFDYARELIEGVRMDLKPRTYASLEDLRTYSYRVASVVGCWLTQLFGRQDPWLLSSAAALGHAMQLTNILRDVGEDLENGRLYLPQDRMARHDLDVDQLYRMSQTGIVTPAYRDLLEELMLEAEREYEKAFAAIPGLPQYFQRPVAVAAHVYRGIHDAIRRNGYDNLRRRARTGPIRKVVLGARALIRLRQVPAWGPEPITMPRWLGLPVPDQADV